MSDTETMDQINARIKLLEEEVEHKHKVWAECRGAGHREKYAEWMDAKERLGWARGAKARLEFDRGKRATAGITLDGARFEALWDGRARAFLAQDAAAIQVDEHIDINGTISGHALQIKAVIYAIERDSQGIVPGFCLVHINQICRVRPE